MRKLFYGFLLMFLSFDLSFNGHSLDVLPDFVGYFLLIRGMKEMEAESGLFRNPRPFAVGMMVYSAVLWIGDLLAVTGEGWLSQILDLIAMIVALYIAWVLLFFLLLLSCRHRHHTKLFSRLQSEEVPYFQAGQ